MLQERDLEVELGDDYVLDLQSETRWVGRGRSGRRRRLR